MVVAVTLLSIVFLASKYQAAEAGPTPSHPPFATVPLPPNIGVGLATDRAVTIQFGQPMDPESVGDAMRIEPETDVNLTWNPEHTAVEVAASDVWATDRRYVLRIGPDALTATGDAVGQGTEVSFTTQTAPAVHRFEVLSAAGEPAAAPPSSEAAAAPPSDALQAEPPLEDGEDELEAVSTTTTITIEFTTPMNQADVEDHFVIAPYVPGEFSWDGATMSYLPDEPLAADSEYSVSVVGAYDRLGNRVGREAEFSFTTRGGAEVVSVRPGVDESGAMLDTVTIGFSGPMDTAASEAVFGLFDIQGAATPVPGTVTWDETGTQLTFVASAPLGAGRLHAVRLADGVTDAGGAPVSGGEWRFWAVAPDVQLQDLQPEQAAAAPAAAPAAPPPPAPVYAPPAYAPGTPLEGYALEQINSARAAYGFPPLGLDAAVSAAASAHAWDQAINMYYSHASLDGRSPSQRLSAAGAAFGLSGENQCYYMGMSAIDTLNWCHSAFMAEPWPGFFNHIGNVLGPDYTRVGIGIGEANGRVVITWDFVQ